VLATSSTGAVVWAARYLPFGGIDQVLADTGALTQTLRFPGQWFQAETGLHQNGMRDYDPTTGRYLQADPLGLVDGPSVYGYARQGPLTYVDPLGGQAKPTGPQGSHAVPGTKGQYVRIDPPQPITSQQEHAHIFERKGCEVCAVNKDGSASHGTDVSNIQTRKYETLRQYLTGRGFNFAEKALGIIGACIPLLTGENPLDIPDEIYCSVFPDRCIFPGDWS
jgi:RHS repeat-associated protein